MFSAGQINYTSAAFDPYIVFDGVLDDVTAYGATIQIANDTTFDTDGEGRGCIWMDTHYNWSDPEFMAARGESLNPAISAVVDRALCGMAPLDAGVLFEMVDTAESILHDYRHGFERVADEGQCKDCGYRLYCG